MPTSAASFARRPRMDSAISWTSRSGSGSDALMALRMVEELLQDDGRGEGIDVALLPGAARARLAKLRFRGGGGERLVHEQHVALVAAREAPRELAREPRHLVRGAVAVPGLPHH